VAVTRNNEPVTYDAIASRSSRHVLAVQGADCPAIFLYDPSSQVIGLAHAGWKPLVRNVVGNVIDAMEELGATRQTILAHISPGAGDQYNAFNWDDDMEQYVRDVFVQAGRDDLLAEPTIRHRMTSEDRAILGSAFGREVPEGSSLKLSHLALTELKSHGVRECNISVSQDSTIVDRYFAPDRNGPLKYHSYRRERPNHGLSISVLFLRCSDPKGNLERGSEGVGKTPNMCFHAPASRL
jgi:copper oxidase (laccase) domain-containing protein